LTRRGRKFLSGETGLKVERSLARILKNCTHLSYLAKELSNLFAGLSLGGWRDLYCGEEKSLPVRP
jgi:hypothetical protein